MKPHPPLYGPRDSDHPGALSEKIAEMRGAIAGTAETVPVSARFDFDLSRAPMVIVTDLETGRQCSVPLCDYHGVRTVLGCLFPMKGTPRA